MSIWPFRRRKPALKDDLSLSADWKVGDLAVCIADHWRMEWPDNPRVNDVLRVSSVDIAPNFDGAYRFIGLGFIGKHPAKRWSNTCFRKAQIAHEPATMSLADMIRRHSKTPQPQET